MEFRNLIPKLDIKVIAEEHPPCLQVLAGYLRGRARRRAHRQKPLPDIIIVAMNCAHRAKQILARLEQQKNTVPVITVVGDDPSWNQVGGTVHHHRDLDISAAINKMGIKGSVPN